MRYFCGVFEGNADFDSIYRIGVLMLRSVTIPFRVPLFYEIRLFERNFSLTTKCEWELG